jgi:hypothetical protein
MVIHPNFQVLSLSVATVFELANLKSGTDVYSVTLYSESG